MKNRIIAIVLVVALIPCLLAVPVLAAGEKDTIINLMSDVGTYNFSSATGNMMGSSGCLAWIYDATSFSVEWYFPQFEFLDTVYFSIQCPLIPQSVYFDGDGDNEPGYATYLGSNGQIHNFSMYVGKNIGSAVITFNFSKIFSSQVSLISCFGTRSDAFSLNKVSLQNQALLYDADDDKLYRYILENINSASGTLPVSTSHLTNYVAELVDPLVEGVLYVHINKDYGIPFDYADSISFVFTTSGSVKDVGFSLLDKSGNYVGQLDVDLKEFSYMKSVAGHFPNGTNMEWPYYMYSATVDLAGYDLSELNLSFFCTVDPVYLTEYESYTGYYFGLTNVVLYPTIEDEPWYTRFGHWITGGFNSVVDAIGNAFNPEGSSDLSQAGEDLSQSAGDIDAAGDVLGSVDQPDVNTGDLFGGFTNFDTGGLKVLSCLTSNAQVTQMMIVVFTFSLAGYIFFGKKG